MPKHTKPKPPTPRPKRARKQTEKAAALPDSDSEAGEDVMAVEEGDCFVDWGVEDSEQLIAHITDDRVIKQALFPSPGSSASYAKGGGKPKTEYHWMLAKLLFTDHTAHGDVFRAVLECKEKKRAAGLRKIWGNKIKNRLVKMVTLTNKHKNTLGQTGEGITHASEIDTSRENEFTNKWDDTAQIGETCPWFFDMRELIGERPNAVPTGLGNSTTEIDAGDWGRDAELDDTLERARDALQTPEEDADEFEKELYEDEARDEIETGEITSADNPTAPPTSTTPAAKTGARPGTSKPVTRESKPKKRKTDAFADLAGAEELTRQKELEVAKARSEENKARIEMKRAELDLRGKKLEANAERRREKRLRKEAKMQWFAARESGSTGGNTSPFLHHDHHTPASTPQPSFPFYHQSNTSDTSGFDFSTPGPSHHSQDIFNSNTPIPSVSGDDLELCSSNSTPSLMDELYSDGPAALPGGVEVSNGEE